MQTLLIFADGHTETANVDPAAQMYVRLEHPQHTFERLPVRWRSIYPEDLADASGPDLGRMAALVGLRRHGRTDAELRELLGFANRWSHAVVFVENEQAIDHAMRQVAAVRALAYLAAGLAHEAYARYYEAVTAAPTLASWLRAEGGRFAYVSADDLRLGANYLTRTITVPLGGSIEAAYRKALAASVGYVLR
jgi:hypothetical protein